MSPRLRIVQVGDVALVAPAIAAALASHAEVINIPHRHVAANRGGLVKALTAPLRLADALGVARDVRALRPDVVHVHWVPHGLVGPLSRRPWVLQAHGDDIRALNMWRRVAFAPVVRSADAVLVSTPDLLRFAPPGAEVLPTPIPNLSIATPALWDVLVNAAALPEKGSQVAFQTLRLLSAMRPGIRLAAHDGPAFEDGPWERLEPTSKSLFQRRLAAGRVILGQFGVGALGISDLEAMALGRPILTWVKDGLYADPPPLFSSRVPGELAARVASLLDSPDERESIGSAGAAWVRRMHDPERVAAKLLSVYRRVLS